MRKDLDTTALADWDSLGVTVKVCVFVMRDAILLKLIHKSAAEAPQSRREQLPYWAYVISFHRLSYS